MSSKASKKIVAKPVEESESEPEVEPDSDNEIENNVNESDDEIQNDDSESEDEQDTKTKKKDKKQKESNEKKQKESFDDISKRIDKCYSDIKLCDKNISELEKSLKSKEKDRQDQYKQLNNMLKLLNKAHTEEVSKVQKIKPKRIGNTTGGFNREHPVPEVLMSFLGLEEGTMLSRPQVMSKLNNKFNSLGLKQGQITTIDKKTTQALKLSKEWEGKEIKFGEFQTFLATFYPKAN